MLTELACMATAIYFEARGEPMVGQVAVAQVIMSRVNDERYPDTVCDVVKQGYYYSWDKTIPIRDKCQFSFWCDGKPEKIKDEDAYFWATEVAQAVMVGTLYDTTQGATHYHAYYVQPSWSKKFTRTVRINDHIFYRWENE
jgi:spore germination cell wall hydrolase CwlJ-like protein|tara:strand:+ start:1920 stop:2342 length:423 start_codon:yes stop_codon:yes gene_type:complete